jgi:mono/diheme cytochrome c family protein
MRNQLLVPVAMALLGACVGGIDSTPPGGGDDDMQPPTSSAMARQMFDSTVAPLLTAKCAACHVGSELSATNMFLGPDGASSYYTTLTNDRAVNGNFNPAAAMILLKGAHEGPAWSSTEAATITAWLQQELKDRGGAPVDPGPGTNPSATPRGAEMAFVGCMKAPASLTDYVTAGTQAYQIAQLNTQQGRCYSCHSPGGAGGQWLGIANNKAAQDLMYGKWQEEVFFTGVFQAQIQPDNTYKIAAAETKICNKGKEKANSLGTHPAFDCTQNNSTGLNNLKAFVAKVQARVEAKDPTCAAAAFASPTP